MIRGKSASSATPVAKIELDKMHIRTDPEYRCNNDLAKEQYVQALSDLNSLQSNTRVVSLAKYKNPEEILPLFARQLSLAGIDVARLNDLNVIHVSGTKGKGSTCAFIESIVRGAGLKTGFYNSPHLIKVTERIRIDGDPIDEDKFSIYFRQIFDRLAIETRRNNVPMPTYFSFLTILAFHIFIQEEVECAVIEVGIGGVYDPTNIIDRPVVCGITTLDFDHVSILGSTIESIAKSKAGIAKTSVPVFTLKHEQEEALEVIRSHTKSKNCPLYVCKPFESNQMPKLGIDGSAQFVNASLACHIADYFLKKVSDKRVEVTHDKFQESFRELTLSDFPQTFRRSLENCSWAGRCQIIDFGRIKFFIDGAHTKKSMKNCLDWYLTHSERCKKQVLRILVVNVIGDRDKFEVLRPMSEYNGFHKVMFPTNRINSAGDTPKSETFVNLQGPNNEKSLENAKSNARVWQSLLGISGEQSKDIMVMPNTSDCIREIHRLASVEVDSELHVLITGSLHLAGSILETLPLIWELKRGYTFDKIV